MKTFVRAGESRVGKGTGTLSVLGLGSCVVVVLYDEATAVGGVAHVLLPDPSSSTTPDRRWMFATTAVPDLVDDLLAAGAERSRITARLIGGACMFQDLLPAGKPNVGQRNVAAARAALSRNGIPIVAQEVGGGHGRSVEFRLDDGRVRVSAHGRSDVYI